MSVKKTVIAKGVEGYHIENTRFNTTLVTYNFYLPLKREGMATNSLLPFLLTSCSNEFRDYIELNIKLLELYGADLSCSVAKCGDLFHVKIGANVINNGFAFDNDRPVDGAAELLSDLIFAPAVDGEKFFSVDVEREKRKTIERIEGEINNKRAFARTRLFEEMFSDDPYGKFIYGSVDEVNKITEADLYNAWQTLISTAYVRINVIGDSPDAVFSLAGDKFSRVNREKYIAAGETTELPEADEVRSIVERKNVTQGKLAMGFTSKIKGSIKTAAALSLFSDIFGGGPYSKLFANVREKQSLCYYCSASARRAKGFLTVESGVEEENAEKTVQAIMVELEAMQNGDFDDSVIEASKKSIIDSLNGYYDNGTAMDIWYSREIDEDVSPLEAVEFIKRITREDIVEAAKGIKLHTVYKLLPKEAGN